MGSKSDVAVIIPYFQRTPGILRRALLSVARQEQCPLAVEVLIVNDASPEPPEPELGGIEWPQGFSARIVSRSNGGPGAARNSGLDEVNPGTRYVAFLDSDDEWSPRHLQRAASALEKGFDFYFADHRQLGQSVGAFARAGRIRPDDHARIAGTTEGLHAYEGDMFDQILRGNVIGTSTVVFRRLRFERARFDVEFTTAGEDYLFWMKLAVAGARISFSTEVEADYGRGVNVYSGSGWGTDGHLRRVQQEILYRRAICRNFSLNDAQREHVARALANFRLEFLRDVIHRLRRRKGVPLQLLRAQAIVDPLTYLSAPRLIFELTAKLLRR